MNGLNEEWKKREFIEAFGRGKVVILGTGQTNMKGVMCWVMEVIMKMGCKKAENEDW